LNQVAVSFNSNGGAGTHAPQLVDFNVATAIALNTFTRTGYTFAGWATSANCSVEFTDGQSGTFTSNTTLYAKWTANSYTVTFNFGTGGGSMTAQGITAGTSVALNANTFTKLNYTFAGWDTSAAGTTVVFGNQSAVTFFGDVTL
jgi:uncharacterized repeat protein (TIGR02543 family)